MPVRIVNSTRITLSARPERFTLNRESPLYRGLRFAMLGHGAGGNKAWDSSPYGKHGTLINMDASNWGASTIGRPQLRFDSTASWSTTDYVNFGNDTSFAGKSSMTAFLWGKFDDAASRKPFNEWDDTDGGVAWLIETLADSSLRTVVNVGGNSILDGGTISDGVWTAIAFTYQAVVGHYQYLNGAQAAGYAINNTIVTYTDSNDFITLGMGKGDNDSGVDGWLCDPMLWDRALSLSEISAISDPDNYLLHCGSVPLILPPDRQLYPVVPSEQRSRFVTAFGL